MFGSKPQLSDGLAIIVLRVRDTDVRDLIVHHLCNIGEQITPSLYELNTADWDPGLWEEEVQRFEDQLQGTNDRLLVWKFAGQTYTRFTIRGSA